MNKKHTRLIPFLIWIALMLFLSTRPAEVSAASSAPFEQSFAVVQEKIKSSEALTVDFSFFLKSPRYLVRKAAHIFLYGMLFIWTTVAFVRRPGWLFYGKTAVFCVVYAGFDELVQTFIPGRTGLLQDVFIDSLGMLWGVAFTILILHLAQKRNWIRVLDMLQLS